MVTPETSWILYVSIQFLLLVCFFVIMKLKSKNRNSESCNGEEQVNHFQSSRDCISDIQDSSSIIDTCDENGASGSSSQQAMPIVQAIAASKSQMNLAQNISKKDYPHQTSSSLDGVDHPLQSLKGQISLFQKDASISPQVNQIPSCSVESKFSASNQLFSSLEDHTPVSSFQNRSNLKVLLQGNSNAKVTPTECLYSPTDLQENYKNKSPPQEKESSLSKNRNFIPQKNSNMRSNFQINLSSQSVSQTSSNSKLSLKRNRSSPDLPSENHLIGNLTPQNSQTTHSSPQKLSHQLFNSKCTIPLTSKSPKTPNSIPEFQEHPINTHLANKATHLRSSSNETFKALQTVKEEPNNINQNSKKLVDVIESKEDTAPSASVAVQTEHSFLVKATSQTELDGQSTDSIVSEQSVDIDQHPWNHILEKIMLRNVHLPHYPCNDIKGESNKFGLTTNPLPNCTNENAHRQSVFSFSSLYSGDECSDFSRPKSFCFRPPVQKPSKPRQRSLSLHKKSNFKRDSMSNEPFYDFEATTRSSIFSLHGHNLQPEDLLKAKHKRDLHSQVYDEDRDEMPRDLKRLSSFFDASGKASCDVGIGPALVCVSGCFLSFEEKSFLSEKTVKLFCFFQSQNESDENKLMLTPEIICLFDDQSLQTSFLISLPTCYVTLRNTEPANVTVERCDNHGNWETFTSIQLDEPKPDSCIRFKAMKSGSYRCYANKEEWFKISKTIRTVVYSKLDGNSDQITIIWCVMDDRPHLAARCSFEMKPSSVYETISEWESFTIKFNQSLKFHVKSDFGEAETIERELSSDHVWNMILFEKFEFQFKKTKADPVAFKLKIKDGNNKELLKFAIDYFGGAYILSPASSAMFFNDGKGLNKKKSRNTSQASDTYSEFSYATCSSTPSLRRYPNNSPKKKIAPKSRSFKTSVKKLFSQNKVKKF